MNWEFVEPLLSAEEAKRADQHTIKSLGISGVELMERAGRSVAERVSALATQDARGSIVPVIVICGPGNNGGDGWVIARRLWQNGIRTAVLSLVDASNLKDEARVAAQHFLAASQNELWLLPNLDPCAQVVTSPSQLSNRLEQLRPALIVDAIFGTGLTRPSTGLIAEVINALNKYRESHSTHILAVDMPSGLPSDGRAWPHPYVKADSTVAIQFRKVTHVSGPHRYACGNVSCVDIGISAPKRSEAHVLLAHNQPPLSLLKPISPDAYKGHFGHVAVLLGSYGMQGACELCALAALRSGAGLATILEPHETHVQLQSVPELMRRIIDMPLASDALERFTSLVIGPGHGQDRDDFAKALLKASRVPVVVDAGALQSWLRSKVTVPIIATPHPGEAASLLKTHATDIEKDRIQAIRDLLKLSGTRDVTWILKGACPIVGRLNEIIVLEGGIPTLSIGGSGDVLAGICAALIPQTHSPFEAAVLGTATHLQAGRNLLSRQRRGFLAHEIADEVPRILFGISGGKQNF